METLNNNNKPYFVYILRCIDDSLYIGITSDIERRIKAHLGIIKGGARYTRSRPVKKIEAAWEAESKSAALRIECALKKLTRKQKLSLIDAPCSIYKVLPEYNSIHVCSEKFLDEIFDRIMNKKQDML